MRRAVAIPHMQAISKGRKKTAPERSYGAPALINAYGLIERCGQSGHSSPEMLSDDGEAAATTLLVVSSKATFV